MMLLMTAVNKMRKKNKEKKNIVRASSNYIIIIEMNCLQKKKELIRKKIFKN
jgi:hypothetical protein